MLLARWPHLFHTWTSIDPQPQQRSMAESSARLVASQLLPYGVASAVTMVTILLRYASHHFLTDNLLPLTLELAVMVSAWYRGLGPGLFATGLSALIIHQVFLPPYFTLALTVGAGVGSSLLIEYLHQARRRAKAEATAHQCAADEILALNQTLYAHLHDLQTRLLLLE